MPKLFKQKKEVRLFVCLYSYDPRTQNLGKSLGKIWLC